MKIQLRKIMGVFIYNENVLSDFRSILSVDLRSKKTVYNFLLLTD